MPKKTKIKRKYLPIRQLKSICWRVFSRFIRYRDKGICYTCGLQLPPLKQQAGHYESRVSSVLFIDERNVHCQCENCNMWKKGNHHAYAERLVRNYGPEILTEFQEKARCTLKRTPQEWVDLIISYEQRLVELGGTPPSRPRELVKE